MSFIQLPKEILQEILLELPLISISSAIIVCRTWKEGMDSEIFWKKFFHRFYGSLGFVGDQVQQKDCALEQFRIQWKELFRLHRNLGWDTREKLPDIQISINRRSATLMSNSNHCLVRGAIGWKLHSGSKIRKFQVKVNNCNPKRGFGIGIVDENVKISSFSYHHVSLNNLSWLHGFKAFVSSYISQGPIPHGNDELEIISQDTIGFTLDCSEFPDVMLTFIQNGKTRSPIRFFYTENMKQLFPCVDLSSCQDELVITEYD